MDILRRHFLRSLLLVTLGAQLVSHKPAGEVIGMVVEHPSAVAKGIEKQVVYVVGQVVQPQGIDFYEGLTLSQAIASAGGLTRDGREDKVTVIRLVGNGTAERTLLSFSLKAIRKHRAVDPLLQLNDIVEVTEKHDRYKGKGRHGIVVDPLDQRPIRIIR